MTPKPEEAATKPRLLQILPTRDGGYQFRPDEKYGTVYLQIEADAYMDAALRELQRVREDLEAMTIDRDLWQGDHNEDCPNLAELRRREGEESPEEVWKRARRAGRGMANCIHNMVQLDRLIEADKAVLSESLKVWDEDFPYIAPEGGAK